MKRIRWNLGIGIALSITALTGSPGAAGTIATPEPSAGGVQWLPHVDYQSLALTVVGPGDTAFQRTFQVGELPTFSGFAPDGLPDGSYNWEIRLAPHLPAEARAALRDGREAGNDGVARQLRSARALPDPESLIQAGHFRVRKGKIMVTGPKAAKRWADPSLAAEGEDTDESSQ